MKYPLPHPISIIKASLGSNVCLEIKLTLGIANAAIIGSALINRLKNCKNYNIIKTAESFIESLVE